MFLKKTNKQKKTSWAVEMAQAQWVKVFSTKPSDVSLVLGAHMMSGENQFCQACADT